MNPAEFESLLTDFAAAQERLRRRTRTTRQDQPRQRAAGAGHPFRHDDRHRPRRRHEEGTARLGPPDLPRGSFQG